MKFTNISLLRFTLILVLAVMASLSDINLSGHGYQHYLDGMIEAIRLSLWFSALFLIAWCALIHLCIIWRFLYIKFGKKIKPNGRKAILITGATSGIGLVLAKHFYKLGFTVIAGYYNSQEAGYKELLELSMQPTRTFSDSIKPTNTKQPPCLFLVQMDVRSPDSIENSSKEIESLLDRHNIELYSLINNAGISRDGPFEWSKREALKDVIDTNLTGVLMVTRQFLLRIIKSKGRVVNVSSGVYLVHGPGISVYGCTKSAIAYFSNCLNDDLKLYGASCCCVMPGNFITTSNIVYPRIRCLQESEAKLTEAERAVYRESIDGYSSNMYRLLEIKLTESGDDPSQVAALHKIVIPDAEQRKKYMKKLPFIMRLFQPIFKLIDGGSKNLEESGVLEGYDDAVRLRQPPMNLYAGGAYYAYFSGPLMEYLPQAILRGPVSSYTKKVLTK